MLTDLSPFLLSIVTMVAFFQDSGILPCFQQRVKKLVSLLTICGPPYLNISLGIKSSPGAFLFFRVLMATRTSSRVGHRSSSGTCERFGSSSRAEGSDRLILFNNSRKYLAQHSRMSFLSLRRVESSAEQTGATVYWVGPYIPLMEL